MQPREQSTLLDRYGRVKRKLRVSLTDRCNFRCPYCMPVTPKWAARETLLQQSERESMLQLFVAGYGIREIRLTGGEPLLSKDLYPSLKFLSGLREAGLRRVSLTSNAYLLKDHAARLLDAGCDDINISLDAIDPTIFSQLSGGREIAPVLSGIDAAVQVGLPVKLNSVIVRDLNESQILPLADWAAQRNIALRFIEFMPLDSGAAWNRERVVNEDEILQRLGISRQPLSAENAATPASYYNLPGSDYRIGVIPTVSRPFCGDCDRLRLTATGDLYACLFSQTGPNLRDLLRGDAGLADVRAAITRAVHDKDAGYQSHPGYTERTITMHGLGG